MASAASSITNVQNNLASIELLEFKRILPAIIIDQYQDWEFRQQFQYEALKGLIANDFVSVPDFIWTMDATQVNPMDKLAWIGVKPLWQASQPNWLFRLKNLIYVPGMGCIGRMLATLSFAGFTKVFTDAITIIKDKISLPTGGDE